VPVGGCREPERRENQHLPWGVGEVILTAQHQRDAHVRIIDGVREKECRRAIGTPHHEIADVIAQKALRSVHQVIEVDAYAPWHAKTQRGGHPQGEPPGTLGCGQLAAGAGIAWRAAGGELRAARQRKFELATEARVHRARVLECGEVLGVQPTAPRLAIRAALILAVRPRIPLDAEPAQIPHEPVHMGLVAALAVGILDAQQELPARVPRQQQVEERGARVSKVQLAGRARGEARDFRPARLRRSAAARAHGAMLRKLTHLNKTPPGPVLL